MTAFFCVKLFEICTTGMAMLSYFSSTQELRSWIAAQVCDIQRSLQGNDFYRFETLNIHDDIVAI